MQWGHAIKFQVFEKKNYAASNSGFVQILALEGHPQQGERPNGYLVLSQKTLIISSTNKLICN
jgi:hypothetical protein